MAITPRNKKVEDQIRRLGRRLGKGPSAVIAEVVERAMQADTTGRNQFPPEEIVRRKALIDSFLADMAANTTEDDRRIARDLDKGRHDDAGVPK
ncbi:hypothetical protein [Phreatobacter stygius]|uniref:Uncharacterized protein n=1 Tax=Phreatobacter stygius TaxID=1940610 RepID=A0A4D7B2I1_9HYPH|nr:hypothetical protein [Phreatobacter stygius]QCI64280.1 hypothetical protein E8M01_08520 [Phreatobacter stygius]